MESDRVHHAMKDLERRYTPGGSVTHLIFGPDWEYPYPAALCGWSGPKTYWRGTGSQEEYDTADSLPLCRRCQRWVDRVGISDAANLAFEAHKGQVDKAGRNYYAAHVCDVVRRVHGQDEIAVAWLHDVLEDTDVTEEQLRKTFPTDVVDAVVAITRRPGESYEDYLRSLRMNPLALIVKLADIASNSSPRRLKLLDPVTRFRLAAKYNNALVVLRS